MTYLFETSDLWLEKIGSQNLNFGVGPKILGSKCPAKKNWSLALGTLSKLLKWGEGGEASNTV